MLTRRDSLPSYRGPRLRFVLGMLLAGAGGCTTYSDIELTSSPSDLDDGARDPFDSSSTDDAGPLDDDAEGVVDSGSVDPVDVTGTFDTGATGALDSGIADNADPSNGSVDSAADSRPADSAAPAKCTDVSSGLIAHWTMNASSIAGTRLMDSSPSKSDGTLVGFSAPVTVAGKFGEALSYPTTGAAQVSISTLGFDQTAGAMNTLSLWFYRDATNLDDVIALLPNSPRYDLWLTKRTHTSLCINTGTADCFGIQDDGLTGRWVHVVVVFANGPTTLGRIYVDGVDRKPSCVTDPDLGACRTSATVALPVSLGGQSDFPFHGLLDEVRVYRRALTDSEIAALYSGKACP